MDAGSNGTPAAFYQAMGCREAEECSQEHVSQEPFDCQLEYVLSM